MGSYKWERQKRRKNYIPPLLSDKDEFVPDTHIGMYSLLTNPKDPAIYMSEAQCQKLRKDTFEGVYNLYKKYGSPDFAIFWNYNIDAINEIRLNKFGTHTKLLPVIGIIQCFEKKMKLKTNGHIRYIISFGINKKKLTDYLKSVQHAKKMGEDLPPLPKLNLPGNKSKDFIIFGGTTIKTDGGTLSIDRNSVYNQFSHWCELNGITKKQGATMALKYFVDNHPLDGLGELADYDVITEFDATVYARKTQDSVDESYKVKFDGTLLSKAKAIIKRYNRDIANIEKETLTINGYVNNAVHLLNQNMPLKYRDPELYEQQQQLELLEQQNGHIDADYDDGFNFDEEWDDE